MSDVVQIQVVGIIPTNRGCAMFMGNSEKTFTIYVESALGQAIHMLMNEVPKERPLTHDLIGHLLLGLGVKVERTIINDVKNGTYFARLILLQENELGKKIIEIDARPSDSVAVAIQAKAPIYVTRSVFDQVEDVTDVLKKLNELQPTAGIDPSQVGLEIPDFEEEDEDDHEDGDFLPPHFDIDEPGPDPTK